MPQFNNKLTGMAINVPVANGSCVDLTTEMEEMPSIESVNAAFKAASENGLRNIIGYTEDPIVSSDAIGSGDTMVFDSQATMIASGKLLKTISWFDNGWGFANRILDLADAYASLGES
jgi:glyceraldehyde 3-phosphate dehydrogenase